MFGPGSFRVLETHEQNDEDGNRVWVVLEVKDDLALDRDIVGEVHSFETGDDFQNTGALKTPEPHWIHDASETAEIIKDRAGDAFDFTADIGRNLALGIGAVLGVVFLLRFGWDEVIVFLL